MLALFITVLFSQSNLPYKKGDLFAPNLFLVRGRVVEIKKEGKKSVSARLSIEHAYVGPTSLRGESFEVYKISEFVETEAMIVGEVGIWWIVRQTEIKNADDNIATRPHAPKYVAEIGSRTNSDEFDLHTAIFARNNDSVHFNQYEWAEKAAQKIERVYISDAPQRVQLLKDLCRTEGECLFIWSRYRLERVLSRNELIAFYRSSLYAKCPLPNKLIIDACLSELSCEWISSEGRARLISHWISDKSENPVDDEELLESLEMDALPLNRIIDIVLDGLTSIHRSDDFKTHLLESFSRLKLTDPKRIDNGFQHLLTQLRCRSSERRLQAAKLICGFAPLTKAQQKLVERLAQDKAYSDIAANLRLALVHTTSFWSFIGSDNQTSLLKAPFSESSLSCILQDIFVPKSTSNGDGHISMLESNLCSTQMTLGFQERLRSCPKVDPILIQLLIGDLNHDKFFMREKSQREIIAFGLSAEPIIRRELAIAMSPEVKHRLERILFQLQLERRFTRRSLKILSLIHTPTAKSILSDLASGSPDEIVTREAKVTLEKLQRK